MKSNPFEEEEGAVSSKIIKSMTTYIKRLFQSEPQKIVPAFNPQEYFIRSKTLKLEPYFEVRNKSYNKNCLGKL